MDDRLDSARAAVSKTYMELSQMGAWHADSERLWLNLQRITEAKRTMSLLTGLVQNRIAVAKDVDNINYAMVSKLNEMELRLAHLQKEGATVLAEKLGLEDTAGQMGGSSDNATDRT